MPDLAGSTKKSKFETCMKKWYSALLVCFFLASPVSAQVASDSTALRTSGFGHFLDRVGESDLFGMSYVSIPLIAGGLTVKGQDVRFRNLRDEYLGSFQRTIDNYIQYSPAAVKYVMKVAGVKGRSTWGQMLLSDALSMGLMVGSVNLLKYSTNTLRPDGSDYHSFPSGHTATDFMTATLLTKEYGDVSPWIGIGAYTVAAGTGCMRLANNKHWLSDVMVGAGIGILSAELGYYFSDLISVGHSRDRHDYTFDALDPPSFLSLYVGFNFPLNHYVTGEGKALGTLSGGSVGLEGAYFFNPYIGIGARALASNSAVITDDKTTELSNFDMASYCAGGYFSYPLSSRWLLGSKLLSGVVHYLPAELGGSSNPEADRFCVGTGLSVTFRAKERFGLRLFADFNLTRQHNLDSNDCLNTLTVGTSYILSL